MYRIEVDPRLKSLIPSLKPDERAQLEANLLKDGCCDALSVIKKEDEGNNPVYVLLDGHNRFEICQARGIKFDVRVVEKVQNHEDAARWIIENQLGRRNLRPDQISYLRGADYMHRPKHPGYRNDLAVGMPVPEAGDPAPEVRSSTSAQNDPRLDEAKGSTTVEDRREIMCAAEQASQEHGVSISTIKRDAQFAAALDRLASFLGPEFRRKMLDGLLPISKNDVTILASIPDEKLRLMADNKLDLAQCARSMRRKLERQQSEDETEVTQEETPNKKAPQQLEFSFVHDVVSILERVAAKLEAPPGDLLEPLETIEAARVEIREALENIKKRFELS